MNWLLSHFRNKLLAGALAAVPIVVIVYVAMMLETYTQPIANFIGYPYPGLGILIALAAIYVLGLFVTSLIGRFVLRFADRLLQRIPMLTPLYAAFKDVLVIPQDKRQIFSHVVLVPTGSGQVAQLGFTSGDAVPNDPQAICVFLPNSPNPLFGRLVVVSRSSCQFLNLSLEQAFKHLLSSGNYEPRGLQGLAATAASTPAAEGAKLPSPLAGEGQGGGASPS
jgi:uncharacterized membrane protein